MLLFRVVKEPHLPGVTSALEVHKSSLPITVGQNVGQFVGRKDQLNSNRVGSELVDLQAHIKVTMLAPSPQDEAVILGVSVQTPPFVRVNGRGKPWQHRVCAATHRTQRGSHDTDWTRCLRRSGCLRRVRNSARPERAPKFAKRFMPSCRSVAYWWKRPSWQSAGASMWAPSTPPSLKHIHPLTAVCINSANAIGVCCARHNECATYLPVAYFVVQERRTRKGPRVLTTSWPSRSMFVRRKLLVLPCTVIATHQTKHAVLHARAACTHQKIASAYAPYPFPHPRRADTRFLYPENLSLSGLCLDRARLK